MQFEFSHNDYKILIQELAINLKYDIRIYFANGDVKNLDDLKIDCFVGGELPHLKISGYDADLRNTAIYAKYLIDQHLN